MPTGYTADVQSGKMMKGEQHGTNYINYFRWSSWNDVHYL